MIDINVDLPLWFIDFMIKKICDSGIKNENISNKQLAEESHKPIIKKFSEIEIH